MTSSDVCPCSGATGRLTGVHTGAYWANALARLGALPCEPLRNRYYARDYRRWSSAASGLTWFSPPGAAEADFYEHLARHLPWYYSDQRWDFETAAALLHGRGVQTVVELGCGPGGFLRMLQNRGIKAQGVELNPTAVAEARAAGLDVTTEDQFPFPREGVDALVLLQVLEHVPEPLEFLRRWIARTRPRLLLVAVPASDTLLGRLGDPLVWPPHHLTLRSRHALHCLGETLDARLLSEQASPLSWHGFMRALAHEPDGKLGALPSTRHRHALRVLFTCARLLGCNWAKYSHTRLALYALSPGS